VEVGLGKEEEVMRRRANGKVEVFCRFVRKNGKYIYPKRSKYFHFWAKPRKA